MGIDLLWGRRRLLDDLAQSPAGTLVLFGDSGIGKSEVLNAIPRAWQREASFSDVRVLRPTDGSLQRALAESLGDIVGQVEPSAASLTGLASRLRGVLEKATSAGAKEAARIGLSAIIGVVEARLGAEVAQMARAGIEATSGELGRGLEGRADALAPIDVSAQLAKLAREVREWVGRDIVLRLDSVDRLSSEDLSLLQEVGASPTDGVFIFGALSTAQAEGLELSRMLRAQRVRTYEVLPLEQDAIDGWLAHASVQPEKWHEIAHATGGYPLFLEQAASLGEAELAHWRLELDDPFEALLDLVWDRLDATTQNYAKRLAVFADRPENAFLTEYLKVSAIEAETVLRSLGVARLFVTHGSGNWFHERRRAHLWGRVIGAHEREALALEAIEALKEWSKDRDEIDFWFYRTLADLHRAVQPASLDEYSSSLLLLDRDALAVLWALVEVVDEAARFEGAAITNEVVSWAELRVGALKDPVATLETLERRGFIAGTANEHVSLTVLVTPDLFGYGSLVSEIVREFSAFPRSRWMTWAMYTVVLSAAPTFSVASVSLGDAGLRAHRRVLDRDFQTPEHRIAGDDYGLGVDFRVEGMPVQVTVFFDSVEARDRASSELRSRPSTPRVDLDQIHLLPFQRVPSVDVVAAVQKLQTERDVDLTTIDDLVSSFEKRVRIEIALRQHLPPAQAAALGLERPRAFLLTASDDLKSYGVIEVLGGSPRVSVASDLDVHSLMSDPLRELRLRRTGHIASTETVGHLGTHWSASGTLAHPVHRLATDLENSAKSFNKVLARHHLTRSNADLELAIQSARDRTQALEAALGLSSAGAAAGLLVIVDRSHRPWGGWLVTSFSLDDYPGLVRVVDGEVATSFLEPAPSHVLEALGLPPDASSQMTSNGDAAYVLGELLGFASEDVGIHYDAGWFGK